jgi:hypothetical protein
MKPCSKCKILKDDSLFSKNCTRKDGLDNQCKDCKRPYRKLHHIINKERDSANAKEWNRKYKKGWYEQNRSRLLEASKKRYKENPDQHKSWILKTKFGITLEQYNRLLKEQNYACAICKKPETVLDNRNNKPKSLAVDHNHVTGEIRGLLCSQCNRSLGGFQDNPEILKQAISYLKESDLNP